MSSVNRCFPAETPADLLTDYPGRYPDAQLGSEMVNTFPALVRFMKMPSVSGTDVLGKLRKESEI